MTAASLVTVGNEKCLLGFVMLLANFVVVSGASGSHVLQEAEVIQVVIRKQVPAHRISLADQHSETWSWDH